MAGYPAIYIDVFGAHGAARKKRETAMKTPTIQSHGYDNVRNAMTYRWSDGVVTTSSERADVTATKLIADSISTNSIIHAEWNGELADTLSAESEDYAESADVVEYWGTDDDGNEWRVHLDKA